MAVPKRRQSRARQGNRRSHDALTARELAACAQCGTLKPTHVICPNCGHYMGRALVAAEEEKKEK